MANARVRPATRHDDPLPGFQGAAVSVPLLWGPLVGVVVAAVLVAGGAAFTLPREQVTVALLRDAFAAVAFAGIIVGGLSSAVFGYPVARWMQRRGVLSPWIWGAMGLGGGLVALAVWQQLLARGLVFQPYFAPWAVAFPVYGALYALLFRWRAARRPAAAP